ncbi:hypothetical protein Glove_253g4 [Diversispora epigaea]|uniref:Transposase Tc1-like domain-containing protein n=1 Tax=Diversispora epigaea TaxID=1348612 RepID=A0A397IBW7_9GLOM|nr:hypothetical protein Glove_253g4 [Diversispora epigaea]
MTDEVPTAVALQKSLKINEKINVSANTIRRAKRHDMMARVKRNVDHTSILRLKKKYEETRD